MEVMADLQDLYSLDVMCDLICLPDKANKSAAIDINMSTTVGRLTLIHVLHNIK